MLLFLFSLVIIVKSFQLPKQLTGNKVDPSLDNFKLWSSIFDIKFDDIKNEKYRYNIWKNTVMNNNQFNNEKHSWKKGLNKFSHLTFTEFNNYHLMAPQSCSATSHNMKNKPFIIKDNAPEKIDWRERHVVSEVKDQGRCGSCWTFSTTGCLEAHHALYNSSINNFMIEFSEQQLVDCAQNFNNFGCNGGLPSQAFEYIRYNGGIQTEFSYYYISGVNGSSNTQCLYNTTGSNLWKYGASVYDVYNVTQYDENDMVTQVGNVGPLSVCFDVVDDFKDYTSGVYSSNTCGKNASSVNHAVLAVGYGILQGTEYWEVKNSWGFTWGDNGYFKIQRGTNECGISSCASYPLFEKTIKLFKN